jgi:hypothetical protein
MMQLRIRHWLTNLTVVIVTPILPVMLYGQSGIILDRLNEPFYYIGINPIAPFANIRESFTSGYLPVISNPESGVSAFVGKTPAPVFNHLLTSRNQLIFILLALALAFYSDKKIV